MKTVLASLAVAALLVAAGAAHAGHRTVPARQAGGTWAERVKDAG